MTNDAPERIWANLDHWTRYQPDGSYGDILEYTEYIRADHAQAEKESAVAAAYQDAADEVSQHLSTPEDVVWAEDSAERIRDRANTDALEAAKAEARAEARQVKPLEWWRSDAGDLCCDTLVGRYQIQTGRERYFMMPAISPGWGNRPDGDAVPSWHKSEESAKAAAQDDYERRVLSALIPADQEEDG